MDTSEPIQGGQPVRMFYEAYYAGGGTKEFHVHGSQRAVEDAKSWATEFEPLRSVERVVERKNEPIIREEIWTETSGYKK
jgi:hypothetical protein